MLGKLHHLNVCECVFVCCMHILNHEGTGGLADMKVHSLLTRPATFITINSIVIVVAYYIYISSLTEKENRLHSVK